MTLLTKISDQYSRQGWHNFPIPKLEHKISIVCLPYVAGFSKVPKAAEIFRLFVAVQNPAPKQEEGPRIKFDSTPERQIKNTVHIPLLFCEIFFLVLITGAPSPKIDKAVHNITHCYFCI